MSELAVRAVDLADAAQAAAFIDLLDHYARDPMGGGEGLSAHARTHLVARLAALPHYRGALAWQGGEAVGLINGFLGFSTFAAQPLFNIHDIVVRQGRRGQGIGQALLAHAETVARAEGCCKLTLEVLSGNAIAWRSYERFGFSPYELDPAAGQARLMQKWLG